MKQRYIYSELAGGLGNQVFIYEFAKYVSSVFGGRIILNTHYIDKKHSKGKSTVEDFELPSSTKTVNFSFLSAPIFIRLKKYLKIFNRFNQSFILILDDSDTSLDKSRIYDLVFERNPRFILIFGFWQNFTYWSGESTYTLKNESEFFLELQKKLLRQNPIVLHYRLGILNNGWEQSWGVLSTDFLSDCIMKFKISAALTPTILWVFSNDINHARALLHKSVFGQDLKVEFIEDDVLTPAEVMLLISKAKFLICSNSTFSLAAAKFGGIANVILPDNLSRYGDIDISPPIHWTRLQSKWLDYHFQ